MLRHLSAACLALATLVAPAQAADDLMIVFDGSGSMWGQIEGRTKIEIARETLSSVLSEAAPEQSIGFMAYGHRERGNCGDIETIVPSGPATQTVPAILSAAAGVTPRGKTPLTDAVRMAAEGLRYTEEAATVVLLTDGVETCEADPCALGAELETAGIDFTAHVVGFDLAAEDEVALRCLAEGTGGLYLSAANAGQLRDALNQVVNVAPPPPAPAPQPVSTERDVTLILRDVEGGPVLNARDIAVTSVDAERFDLAQNYGREISLTGRFPPGVHALELRRNSQQDYPIRMTFEVPDGPGPHVIERVLAGRLAIDVMVNASQPYDYAARPPSSVRPTASVYIDIFPVANGVADESAPFLKTPAAVDTAIPPGRYLLRGTIDRTTTVEQEVEVLAGTPTRVTLDFDATQVFLQALSPEGQPVDRPSVFVYDGEPRGRTYWRRGTGVGAEPRPFYLPTGIWGVNLGREGGGATRSAIVVTVPGDHQPIRRVVPAATTDDFAPLTDPARQGCLAMVGAGHTGCLAEARRTLASVDQPTLPGAGPAASDFAASGGGSGTGLAPSADDFAPAAGAVPSTGGNRESGVIPVGLFAIFPEPQVPVARSQLGEDICRTQPTAMFPDGLMVMRRASPVDESWTTTGHGNCRAGDNDTTICEMATGYPDAPTDPRETRLMTFDAAGGDDVLMCDGAGQNCLLFYACVRPGAGLRPIETRKMIQRSIAGPNFSYADDGTLTSD
ncbi:vWA domain-containing protein [Jannaschia pohangensis]|uniref:Mg-chelatase subunit ChlD n=1 Tax=Jannaschia pohangensis TaxID=390807 RepID=A0A1I3IIQ2_9RHOB|nr:VWA domain-containing protein [Jannaschia pohangensis]SFI47811.1 Mg-chelatase subunit ChlD [Jannaschia pohangensis]